MSVTVRVSELASAMDEIALASNEQMQGISQVTVAVGQMDGVTQSNAALVEESTTASQSLAEQVHALRGMVGAFKVCEETRLSAQCRRGRSSSMT